MRITEWMVSPLRDKKYRVILSNGRHVDFGDKREFARKHAMRKDESSDS